ncbi:4Fe-4S dicluster domain-containing protein [Chloroflexota bacterium]
MAENTGQPETAKLKTWGKVNYPFPKGAAFIECDEMKCVGCGICQMACAMRHFGVINKDIARIRVRKYLVPLPKAVMSTCVQCREGERECEKACPVSPSAIYFDEKSLHMVIAADRCLGNDCLKCQEACPAQAVRSYPAVTPVPFVCDLCDTANTGNVNPQCVNVCPYNALRFLRASDYRFSYSFQDMTRKHPDEKADLISKRLYPLSKDKIAEPGWSDKQ